MPDPSQNVVASYVYDVFGRLMDETEDPSLPADWSMPYRFSTKRYYPEFGMSDFGFRFYSAKLGRWINRDPLGEEGGLNLYAFVGNSPVSYVDALGLWGEDVHSGIGSSDYGTYIWSMDVGFSDEEARFIAYADNAIDEYPFTSWFPSIGEQSRHFDQNDDPNIDSRLYWAELELNLAKEALNDGDKNRALGHIGKGLHSIQDYYAHKDWDTGYFGMGTHPGPNNLFIKHIDYDDWHASYNKYSAWNTAWHSIYYLGQLRQAMGGK